MDLESDAVAEPVEVALVELRARRLGALGRVSRGLERLARDPVQLAAVGPGAHGDERPLERLAGEPPVAGQLGVRLLAARHERARHVRPAAGAAVARPDVDDDALAGLDRAVARLVADGALRPVGDDDVVGEVTAALVADALHLLPDLLARQSRPQLADQLGGGRHRRVGGRLGAADALDLGRRLRAPRVDERLRVHHELDAPGPQVVGEAERELGRDERAPDAEPRARTPGELEVDLVARQSLGEQVVGAEP